jgi:hypothetical protein
MKNGKTAPAKAKAKTKVPVKKAAPAKAANPMGMDAKWQAEQDARTLMQAEEIKADKGRLGKAKAHASKQAAAATRVAKL